MAKARQSDTRSVAENRQRYSALNRVSSKLHAERCSHATSACYKLFKYRIL